MMLGKQMAQDKRQSMNKREVGNRYESIAVAFLEKHGFRIIERNYFTRIGEIDIIALEGDCLCFAEVKYRATSDFGYPSEAVNKRKQKRIVSVAQIYMKSKDLCGKEYRFDVIEILGNEIRLIRNSFGGN